jgi:hypothetical protein
MKKVIRLTEDDLTRLVKRVIKEQVEEMDEQGAMPIKSQQVQTVGAPAPQGSATALSPNVKRLVDDVKNNRLTISDLNTALMFLKRPNPKQTGTTKV